MTLFTQWMTLKIISIFLTKYWPLNQNYKTPATWLNELNINTLHRQWHKERKNQHNTSGWRLENIRKTVFKKKSKSPYLNFIVAYYRVNDQKGLELYSWKIETKQLKIKWRSARVFEQFVKLALKGLTF